MTGVEEDVKDFVSCLLVGDVSKRLGCGPLGSNEVKGHPWLKCLNWIEVDGGGLRSEAGGSRRIPRTPYRDCPGRIFGPS